MRRAGGEKARGGVEKEVKGSGAERRGGMMRG